MNDSNLQSVLPYSGEDMIGDNGFGTTEHALKSAEWQGGGIMSDKIELVQKIGNEVCEECGPCRDCGLDLTECDRIKGAIVLLDEYASVNYNL